ncbi:hypothetical protein L208DRAFT_1256887 [Tricholoma matsutake]|nr:hypothetical protein L208DRAFT_1256887 [Tricholoma matsutake 945]
MKTLASPIGANCRGATTALVWIWREDEPEDGLVYGTQNGYLISWKQSKTRDASLSFEEMHCAEVANPGEITGLAFNAASNHLAVCNQNSVVQMFTIDATMTPRIIFSIPISNYILDIILFLCCTYQFYQKSEPFFVAAVC